MTTSSNDAIAVASDHNRKIVVGMAIAVAYGSAVNNHAVIEQRAVSFLDCFHSIQKMRKQAGMVAIDFRKRRNLARGVTVMR